MHKNHPILAFHNIAAPVIFNAGAFICVLSGKASFRKSWRFTSLIQTGKVISLIFEKRSFIMSASLDFYIRSVQRGSGRN